LREYACANVAIEVFNDNAHWVMDEQTSRR
jgi:hypothetical protein